jgi:hypothetical protein
MRRRGLGFANTEGLGFAHTEGLGFAHTEATRVCTRIVTLH